MDCSLSEIAHLKTKFGVETEQLETIRRERYQVETQKVLIANARLALEQCEADDDEPVWLDYFLVPKHCAQEIIQKRLQRHSEYAERLDQVQHQYETRITFMHERLTGSCRSQSESFT